MPASPPDKSSSIKSGTEQSGAEQVATLMEQVRSKDALVLQLTERLEAAAEQLDRIQRTGSDRRHPGTGGGSRELVEQTGQLTTRVEEAIEIWGQSSNHYETILLRLDEIAECLQNASDSTTPSRAGGGGGSKAIPTAGAGPANVSAASGGASGQGSFWERMKASMVDGTPPPSLPSHPSSSSPAPSSQDQHQHINPAEVQERSLEYLAPPPVVIHVDDSSMEDLKEAVAARDAYISTLISELRTAQPLPPLPTDLHNCDWAPEELVSSLRDLEHRMKTEIQREGLDLSLERARLARERVRLDQVKAQLEGQIKRLTAMSPGTSTEASPASSNPDPAESNGKLSWLKRLQPKKS